MKSSKKTVLLTGASGNMGQAALAELFQRTDQYQVKALALDTPQDRKVLAPYQKMGLTVVWGDLTCYRDVLEAVTGADIVLHVGGIVSPYADTRPELTMKVNIGAAQNIVQAIHAQPDPDRVKVVYIGTMAQYGNRPVPIHWGRVGDPIKLSTFDVYALSKTVAERIIIESGLKNWVSLRQTGIARMAATEPIDPITFHITLDGVLEWVTPADSGRLLANLCEESVPESFWGSIYNIGGGLPNRLTNLELFEKLLGATGVKNYQDVLDPHWFALKNFHGVWFTDSDALQELVPFRHQTFDEYIQEQSQRVPWYIRMGSAVPQLVRKKFESVARGPRGTLSWFAEGEAAHIKAYFGSLKLWKRIRGWEDIPLVRPPDKPLLLDHGFPEKDSLSLAELREAARFRGGELLSGLFNPGDWRSSLDWRCHAGHEFTASLNLILKGGHWCPICIADTASYPEMARRSAFFHQVMAPDLALI